MYDTCEHCNPQFKSTTNPFALKIEPSLETKETRTVCSWMVDYSLQKQVKAR